MNFRFQNSNRCLNWPLRSKCHFLSQGLLFISSDNLKQTVLDLNLEKQGIRNSVELITYLLASADRRNYSKRELLENIEKIRKGSLLLCGSFPEDAG